MLKALFKELNALGWRHNKKRDMNNYYVFTRGTEELEIDTDKMKIHHYDSDEDGLNTLTYETLRVVVQILEWSTYE